MVFYTEKLFGLNKHLLKKSQSTTVSNLNCWLTTTRFPLENLLQLNLFIHQLDLVNGDVHPINGAHHAPQMHFDPFGGRVQQVVVPVCRGVVIFGEQIGIFAALSAHAHPRAVVQVQRKLRLPVRKGIFVLSSHVAVAVRHVGPKHKGLVRGRSPKQAVQPVFRFRSFDDVWKVVDDVKRRFGSQASKSAVICKVT